MLFRLDGVPCYVGKGKGNRWVRHQGRSKHCNKHLGSIIDQARRIGKELPRIKVAENLPEEEAFRLEKILIGMIGRGKFGPLVNLTDGGDGLSGYMPSAELIERQAQTRRGRKLTPQWKAKISASLKGRKMSPEHAEASRLGQLGSKKSSGWWSTTGGRKKQKENNPSRFKTGHRHSPETIEKIRAARFRQANVSTAGQFKKGQKPVNATANLGDQS